MPEALLEVKSEGADLGPPPFVSRGSGVPAIGPESSSPSVGRVCAMGGVGGNAFSPLSARRIGDRIRLRPGQSGQRGRLHRETGALRAGPVLRE